MNFEINSIVVDVLQDINGNVQTYHIKALIKLMLANFKVFKQSFLLLIDKILTLEKKDQLIKGIYKLLDRFYSDLFKITPFQTSDANSLLISLLKQLSETYLLPKIPTMVQLRSGFMLLQIFSQSGWSQLTLDIDTKDIIHDAVIDMLISQRHTLQIYGIQICAQICKFENNSDDFVIQYLKVMTHSRSREVRKVSINSLKAPFSPLILVFLAKRLRDKDPEIRRITFNKLTKNNISLESFQSKEVRMLIIKEGLTDNSEQVRIACQEFLSQTLKDQDNNYSYFFELIDCKEMQMKEYYVQLSFLIMNFIFYHVDDDVKIAKFLSNILQKLKDHTQLEKKEQVKFEDLLFMRIAFEFNKICKKERSLEFFEELDKAVPDFEEYQQIFYSLLRESEDRLTFSEWVKFSLQLHVQDEMVRRNIVSLMFKFIGEIQYSYEDYQTLLKPQRMLYNDYQRFQLDNTVQIDYDSDEDFQHINDDEEEIRNSSEDQVIEIEIRAFQELGNQRDIQEYCKPFTFDSLVLDTDDVCRIAVIVCRKLLDERADEFSLSMLQAISDIKEHLEDAQDGSYHSFKSLKERMYKRLEEKLDSVNDLIGQDNYDISELNRIMKKVRKYVVLIEELNLKEKLCFKRALNLGLILLKQCRTDANDSNLVSICDTLIGPTIQSKDKDNMLLAIECIGLLCLLDKELFSNYSKIFQTILTEDVMENNLPEKIISLKSAVDSLIIHGVDAKTQKLQKIIIEDYLLIKDKVLRQITIEGICKMLFSRKLTVNADQEEMEYLISYLVIQWFDKSFNWQNSLVRQVLSVFFKSFILFSDQRCLVMLKSITKVVFSILESKYGGTIQMRQLEKQKAKNDRKKLINKKKARFSSGSEDSDFSSSLLKDYLSDDSQFYLSQAKMVQICKQLDGVQISKVFMMLLSKEYINTNTVKDFQIKDDLNIEYLIAISAMNTQYFKKVAIVKEFLIPIVDYVDISKCEDLSQLANLKEQMEKNLKMLVQNNAKIKTFIQAIDKRIMILKRNFINELDELNEEEKQIHTESNYKQFQLNVQEYEKYYEEKVINIVVDLVIDDDDEFKEIRKAQNKETGLSSPYNLKNKKRLSDLSQESQVSSEQINQRIGSRNRTNLLQNKNLESIKEQEERKEIGSCIKPNKAYETIIEEGDNSLSIEEGEEEIINEEKIQRKGIMSKISRQMAKDFHENKKKSYIAGSCCTQINEQRIKEEYNDGRTIFKISKNRSNSPINDNNSNSHAYRILNENQIIPNIVQIRKSEEAISENVAHNLSVRFEKLNSEEKDKNKLKAQKRKQANHRSQIDESLSSIRSGDSKYNPSKGIITRSQMKSMSQASSYHERSQEEEDSDSSMFGFLQGKMTRLAKKQEITQKQNKKTFGKRIKQDISSSGDDSSKKENINQNKSKGIFPKKKKHAKY